MQIRRGGGDKSDLSGLEYCRKSYCWVETKWKLCQYFLASNIAKLIFLGFLEAVLTSDCFMIYHVLAEVLSLKFFKMS